MALLVLLSVLELHVLLRHPDAQLKADTHFASPEQVSISTHNNHSVTGSRLVPGTQVLGSYSLLRHRCVPVSILGRTYDAYLITLDVLGSLQFKPASSERCAIARLERCEVRVRGKNRERLAQTRLPALIGLGIRI